MIDFLRSIFLVLQILVGYQLIIPALLLVIWGLKKERHGKKMYNDLNELDFAIIVTAYQHTNMLAGVVKSILNLEYRNYHVYIVADNCPMSTLDLAGEKVSVLIPQVVLGSNTKSHSYAFERFLRPHDCVTIIDSDNLVDSQFLTHMNSAFWGDFKAVQGLRAPKKLDTTIACLDAARDIYCHFYDGKVLFEVGSSATLSGSGMAFDAVLYRKFLDEVNVQGAGFDKVLQAWLVQNKYRIAFDEHAVVYDEKTSKTDQLVQQRSRWINSWFKYARLGGSILWTGIRTFDLNSFLFGIILLRPPLFIFLALSVVFMLINLVMGTFTILILWLICFISFVLTFFVPLLSNEIDPRILSSLKNIPKFVFYQFVSLLNVRRANKISVSTKHDREEEL